MPPLVIPIDSFRRVAPSMGANPGGWTGTWSLLEIARPGCRVEPLGILLAEEESDRITLRLRTADEFADLDEPDADILDFLKADLLGKAGEMGARNLLESLEDSLSGFLRVSDRTAIQATGDPRRTVDELFDEHVDNTVRPGVTHFPVYGLRAAATKFGEGMAGDVESWRRAPEDLRLTEDHFAVWVVGRSMEPLIPDGSLCLFRGNVTGSRQGKRLLIEKFDENDFSARYTVKKYSSVKKRSVQDEDEWEHEVIRLTPLNPEFEAFELAPDAFRVMGEFVEVLES